MNADTSSSIEITIERLQNALDHRSPDDYGIYLEINYYMRNQLLRDSDVMSMAWGLELRVPFVDHRLLETIATIPSSMRLKSGKKLLTASLPELPQCVLNRPKQAFFFPLQKWMDQEWKDDFFIDSLDHLDHKVNLKLWYRRWSLAILKFWWEQVTA